MVIAASACLLGYHCRYDGRTSPSTRLIKRAAEEVVVPICPEELGGLPTPRTPAHFQGGDGFDVLNGRARVTDLDGNDVTEAFLKGAFAALKKIRENGTATCFLKDRSPSCGVGSLSSDGEPIGVTAALLMDEGIEIVEVKAEAIGEPLTHLPLDFD
jgi:uncharacterized protein YbbK (DUF523 family)